MIGFRRIAVWAGALFLAVAFVLVGVSKLAGASAMRWTERFGHWGYPANAQYVVGVFEILGGLGVLVPRWRRAASLILGALMTGALFTHVVNAEFPRVIPPLVLGGLAFLTYWSHGRPTGEETPDRRSGA
jgi:uncharacterized membrane protein YphA (DoxX/SURF4 family)